MATEAALGRRRFATGLLAAGPLATLVAACTPAPPPQLTVRQPADAPAADRVTRLLVWLPPNSAAIDSPRLAVSLSEKLAARGVEVEAIRARPLELDRGDAQRPLIARFRPSHRLDIELGVASASAGSTGGSFFVSVTGQLYTATGTAPIRRIFFSSSERIAATPASADKFSDDLIAKLQDSGIMFGR